MDIKKKILNSNAKHRVKVEALLQEFAKIPEETLNRRPANGGWSAMQTAWHLLLAEELSYQYVQKKLGFGGSFDTVGFRIKGGTSLGAQKLSFKISTDEFQNNELSEGMNIMNLLSQHNDPSLMRSKLCHDFYRSEVEKTSDPA